MFDFAARGEADEYDLSCTCSRVSFTPLQKSWVHGSYLMTSLTARDRSLVPCLGRPIARFVTVLCELASRFKQEYEIFIYETWFVVVGDFWSCILRYWLSSYQLNVSLLLIKELHIMPLIPKGNRGVPCSTPIFHQLYLSSM